MSNVPHELFESAVAYYARYRSVYPAGRVDALAAQLGLDSSQRVLDIGCGTGQLAIPTLPPACASMIPGLTPRREPG